MAKKLPSYEFQGVTVKGGQREMVTLPIGRYLTGQNLALPVHVVQGKKEGPVLLVTAAVHGDELNGVEIIRRLLSSNYLRSLRGTLLAIPVVSGPAFAARSRYLPDRRDLNRLFPGGETGSVGGRIARALTECVIPCADCVIDLHTGAVNRPNLPQLRVTKGDKRSRELAEVFAAPATLLAGEREGSFRTECRKAGKPCLLFEGGEALRLDAGSIKYGLRGVIRVMRELKMLPKTRGLTTPVETVFCRRSWWERAPSGGLFTPLMALGRGVHEGDTLGFVADIMGQEEQPVLATRNGILIGRTNEGVADEGDALFHIAEAGDPHEAQGQIAEGSEILPETWREVEDVPVPYDPVSDTVVGS
ncbi:succinylglutamate desuccinylase/aspartoacylase family protein [Roseibacillus ishigakijimensis]|uniref:Succinylglutamate desuccinylase/aspartoacylase family protein n=1 Tax=Roseibacillus ishigakijimensis TaxID=454146 RepID=A0A934RKK4_9BACT|nr:succinylglutamate desuccinylase/aspartoacylase family protein [Roseibacillus ishigakijimensis]MBK1833129.1 succinylglutamate desuccinylase/aspartoacylase family protein [Roseibacillus ishigakijimensis]